MKTRYIIVGLMMVLAATVVRAQIKIGGNVYGGGNAGDLNGQTTVIVRAGDLNGVYGGARQANVSGSTNVHIDGEHMSDDIVVNAVYGGNDIAGSIGGKVSILTSPERKATQPYSIFIGQLYGGGNGDYGWSLKKPNGKFDVTVDGKTISDVDKPEVREASLDLCGGTFGYVYGGGNNVTVTGSTDITINNSSTRTKIASEGGLAVLTTERLKLMGINTEYFNKTTNHIAGVDKFLFSRVFGGNNKADMHIRPFWHLKKGSIENLYSGGNEGRMTSSEGLLLEIGKKNADGTIEASEINVYNVYGGCRKADVCPEDNYGKEMSHVSNLAGYSFPDEFAARVLVRSGKIHNVYGGNDVRGKVYFGNAVGVYTSISGDVYGGGNGSYPYTDNADLANDLIYGDFYYDPVKELKLTLAEGATFTQQNSVDALNLVRPNAEQVSIRIAGNEVTDAADNVVSSTTTIIGGSVYCGGNSATLKKDPAHANISNNYPVVELKIGSHIMIDKVFLGNNGANMVNQSDNGLLAQYNGDVTPAAGGDAVDFSTLDLTDGNIFKEYMKGCAMDIIPSIAFDTRNQNGTGGDPATYRDYTAYIGSLYCGGNVGSMIYDDVKPMNFNRKIIIFDKLVGGCNNAIIPAKAGVNAYYEGGITGAPNSTTGNKVELTLSGLKIEPKRWKNVNDKTQGLEWNTIYASTGLDTDAIETTEAFDSDKDYITSSDYDLDRRFKHGHVYGGCYTSGIVNGNVVINIDGHIMEREKLFDVVKTDDLGEEESLYGHDQTQQERFKITKRNTGVLLGQQGMDVLGAALNVFGGGKGQATQIWGSTTINLNRGYTFQIFGGSEEGVIGKPDDSGDYDYSYQLNYMGTEDTDANKVTMTKKYKYNPAYSCYVNLKGKNAGVSKKADQSEDMAECEFMYGGGFLGPICGDTYVNLGRGRIFNSFAGSCNADILGHAETYIGRQIKDKNDGGTDYSMAMFKYEDVADGTKFKEGFPWVRDYTYGGNDLGGLIMTDVDFSGKVRNNDIKGMVHKNNATNVLKANAYTEYLQGRAEGIFGGCYGTYDYTDTKFRAYFDANGDPVGNNHKPYMKNAFVNFRPTYTQSNNKVNKVYGAGQGEPGEKDRDNLQDRSYVLIDIPQEMAYYKDMEVFGAGAWSGVGMKTFLDPSTTADADLDAHSTIIDLVRGQLGAVYGGSYAEGLTRRTVINVPEQSTINIENIFGGAYGTQMLPPCDVYESNVNYNNTSEEARVTGKIYGGNNSERRTLYTHVNISSPVWSDKEKGYLSTVYGAGRGLYTWSEYTQVNLLDGARVYEVYGGGEEGHILNAESVQKYMQTYQDEPSSQISTDDPNWSQSERWEGGTVGGTLKSNYVEEWKKDWKNAWAFDGYYTPDENYSNYIDNTYTNLSDKALVRTAEMDDRDYSDLTAEQKAKKQYKYNTNVIINKGATVVNYAYGGGWGKSSLPMSGDVYGQTYIALLGGTVKKDIYAAGTSGSVDDVFGVGARSSTNLTGFTASANAYVEGGSCRNVYGGGWEGAVGKHTGVTTTTTNDQGETITHIDKISGDVTDDVYGETHVVIGISQDKKTAIEGYGFYRGVPAVQRNAYGGGEGGPVYGTAHITLNNGYIGYEYNASGSDSDKTPGFDERYEEKIIDDTYKDADGHFVANQNLYDSGCMFGGGYVDNSSVDITEVKMYGGHVRNALFGGGEIAAIGRGKITVSGTDNSERSLDKIFKAGKTNLELFGGHVHRNVFGGGRGYNNLGDHGTLFSDGYVFGQTEVHIHGGEIGTEAGLAMEYGNVFGGGDIGYVYSAYEYDDSGVKKLGRGIKKGVRYIDAEEGYYYRHKISSTGTFDSDGDFEKAGTEYIPTEDCKVLIEPHCKVLSNDGVYFPNVVYAKGAAVSTSDLAYLKANPTTFSSQLANIDANGRVKMTATNGISFSRTYAKGEYVPTYALNTLSNKNTDPRWNSLDVTGVIIHNAVFAGGNTASGSSTVYANTTSVFGNATASLHDVYHRDLITVGTGHIGGLYGDGNLTFVDGYRGLNITNYGTDYYSIDKEITIGEYESLPVREAAYYELKYTCTRECKDDEGTTYYPKDGNHSKASTLTADDIKTLFKNKTYCDVFKDDGTINTSPTGYWKESGVLPVYAGRLLNSIQRADFCGVFGSRMVMQGAQDRVPEEVDYTNYTINRVREVSLNQQHSVISSDEGDAKTHGNYFGIYNIVNFLGALTSDVHFDDIRETSNTSNSSYAADGQTYYNWKGEKPSDRRRNNGSSLNKVALASGVYLELTNENGRGTGLREKEWGYITGIVELDLINVQTGIGGGYVYAKNEHGTPTRTPKTHATLTALNAEAITRKDFTYSTSELKEWETSGNFVHSTQTIIDDCYNISGKYQGDDAVPAHYWYIKGAVYVYDQYISAYTGAPNAYRETVDIPLTITAASHGTMRLLDVKPNRYAYFTAGGTPIEEGKKIVINDVDYYKNDPISYWDYFLLSRAEKELFTQETYVIREDCWIGSTPYKAGQVILESDYKSLFDADGNPPTVYQKKTNDEGQSENVEVSFYDMFRSSNNMSHDTGYILTYRVNNPTEWSTWYTEINDNEHNRNVAREKNQTGGDDYEDGPTYHLKESVGAGSVLGQREYKEGDIISNDVETTYKAIPVGNRPAGQATFTSAYIVTKQISTANGNLNPGTTISSTEAAGYDNNSVAPAYICTSTIKLSQTEYIYLNSKMTFAEKEQYKTDYPDLATAIDESVVPAYYCTEPGLYGGDYYVSGKNYRGLEAWSSMSPADRQKFEFNYDALDLLIDPTYSRSEGKKYQYDGAVADTDGDGVIDDADVTNEAGFSLTRHVDYTAEYNSSSPLDLGEGNSITVKRNGEPTTTSEIKKNDELSRTAYESLTNEQRHYSSFSPNADDGYKVYVVHTPFQVGSSPYAIGQTISASEFGGLSETDKDFVTILEFTAGDYTNTTFYYCRESYEIPADGHAVNSTMGVTGIYKQTVPIGAVIEANTTTVDGTSYTGFAGLTNKQKDFTIHGIAPTETSTLFVSRNSDIFDLSKEKIITVIYQYDYEEVDSKGNVTPISERHVVNIHIAFKSGIPSVEDIKAPGLVLPGTRIGLREPNVTPGAYEVTGGGWELFEKKSDAESHTNAVEYSMTDPLYWYQDGYYLAYYAKTYLGKTYSNAVPVGVANYHDLKKVMETTNHYYIDKPNQKRDPKIYINDYSGDETGSKNGLDLLKGLVDLSYRKTDAVNTYGAFETPGNITGAGNLDLILRADIDHSGTTWTPIANENGECFSGTLHGDGHHLSGLKPATGTTGSLFNHLCGEVYNLGVSGTFTGAGIAETGEGYVENCWVKTDGTPYKKDGENHFAVFGDPSRTESDTRGIVQVVNSYYPVSNDYQTPPAGDSYKHGRPTQMPDKSFFNGEVAYDLNGFYLKKRFYHGTHLGAGEGTTKYYYLEAGEDGILTESDLMKTGYYPDSYALYRPVGTPKTPYMGYVENRFYDGDYRYADGTIPEDVDSRLRIVEEKDENDNTVENYYFPPIWPDDYMFFGQTLSYNYDTRAHQKVPSSYTAANRVYRAPAYFRSYQMDVAHFNADAVLAGTEKLTTAQIAASVKAREAYKDMTAIDFTGYNDAAGNYGYLEGWNTWSKTSQLLQSQGKSEKEFFFPPLLDEGVTENGLSSIIVASLTPNMLVYTDKPGGTGTNETPTATQKTANVVSSYLTDESYDAHETNSTYHTVSEWDAYANAMHGHWVYKSGDSYTTDRDHYLVDKQDFNAPISYTFQSGSRMWHQRVPGDNEFVDREKGWQAISLPFSAEIVTTNQKGEITHFYNGSDNSKNGTGTKIGHEYWLRHLTGDIKQQKDEQNQSVAGVMVAELNYPSNVDGSEVLPEKVDENTFLWDYYYKGVSNGHKQLDANRDKYVEYQEYYKNSRTYDNYALLTKGEPYILGLPGVTYYEFDLSGKFVAGTTADIKPEQIGKQTITFASPTTGVTVRVSDEEMAGVTPEGSAYTFKPTYLNNPTITAGRTVYQLDDEGASFRKAEGSAISITAFRPYFIGTLSGTRAIDQIVFGQSDKDPGVEEHGDPRKEEINGGLRIWTKKDKIFVESTLSFTEDVRVVTPAGITVASFSVTPGQTVEVQADFSGMYIVHTLDGLYTKKVSVRK